MLDKDLAEFYEVKPIRLREQVKRNSERFPESFMFQLVKEEAQIMVSQNAIPSLQHLGGSLPYAFTEHGILQLANVLRGPRAVQMSIRIIEVFVRMRELIRSSAEIVLKVEEMEKRLSNQDEPMLSVLEYLKSFIQEKEHPRQSIEFKLPKKD